jgi:hypothetical protein
LVDGDRFTAGDLMMTTVLRILKHTDIVTSDNRLAAYVERCTARPAFRRALDAQLGDFRIAAWRRPRRVSRLTVVPATLAAFVDSSGGPRARSRAITTWPRTWPDDCTERRRGGSEGCS